MQKAHLTKRKSTDKYSFTIICCTDGKKLEKLRNCLESILNNKYNKFELFIIDQSQENVVRELVDSFGKQRIVYFRVKPLGLSYARNFAIENVKTNVVIFTDDDCVVEKKWIYAFEEIYKKYPNIVGLYGRVLPYGFDDDSKFCHAVIDREDECVYSRPIIPYKKLGHGNNMSFKIEVFKKVGLFNEHLGVGSKLKSGEDTDMVYRILRRGLLIAYSPYPLVYHDNWVPLSQALNMDFGYITGSVVIFVKYLLQGERNTLEYLLGRPIEIRRDFFQAYKKREKDRMKNEIKKMFYFIKAIPLGILFVFLPNKKYGK